MLKPIAILLSLSMAYGADDAKKPPFAEEAFNRVVDANASDAIKAYSDYLTKLDGANKKVLAGLEAVKKDLNDTSKNKNMTIQDRAKAIADIEERIAVVKKDGVGETVVGKVVSRVDPIADIKVDLKAYVVGKWRIGNTTFEINRDGSWTTAHPDFGGNWRIIKGQLELTANKGNNQIFTVDPKDGAKWTWNGGKSVGIATKIVE